MEKQLRIEEVIRRRRERVALWRGYLHLVVRLALLGLVGWVIFTFGFLITQMKGQGMFPAVKDGDLCIVFRQEAQTLFGERFKQNDIVFYRVDGQRYMGRIVAVPGDTVSLSEGGSVTVNGASQIREILYATYPRGELQYPYQIPANCVYVLGDHRNDTTDSRDFGPIPLSSVEGKVITILRRRGL